jgi:hypothetical protein
MTMPAIHALPVDPAGAPRTPGDDTVPAPRADYLGAAVVVSLSGHQVTVRLPDASERTATMALAFPYRPEPGDELLVIGKDAAYFVIGLLHGAGQATLAFEGDVELRSLTGKVAVSGAEGVELHGKLVSVYADKVKVVAESLSESVGSCMRRVREMLSVQAGELRTAVRGLSYAQAKQTQIQSEENVAINGKQIHLG